MPTTTTETNRITSLTPEELSERNAGASLQQRVAIPMRVDRWSFLPPDQQEHLIWFHQFVLDQDYDLDRAGQALGYERSVAHRVLNGVYGPPHGKGSWENIVEAIVSFKKIAENRAGIQQSEFTPNSVSRLIFGALDYALANNSITTIIGESGQGKTLGARAWRDANNHGRSVLITAPVIGGRLELLRRLVKAVGAGQKGGSDAMASAAARAFNANRILIVDEAHRLLPTDPKKQPIALEFLRDIHDESRCALALVGTERFAHALTHRESTYVYEQVLGRIGLPVRLPRLNKCADIEPIVRQYVKRPSAKLLAATLEISNDAGRIRILVERLKIASRMASKARRPMIEEDFFKALALVRQMGGELIYAAK